MLNRETKTNIGEALLEGICFFLEDELIFYVDSYTKYPRLYILPSLQHKVFEIVYNHRHHAGLHRFYERICATIYIENCPKHSREYIEWCKSCGLNQGPRHKPYSYLNPIDMKTGPIETVAADFITKMPPTSEAFD